jgi:hypothetical protein
MRSQFPRVTLPILFFLFVALPAQGQMPSFSLDSNDPFLVEGAKLCMPPFMVLDGPGTTHTWFARSTGGTLDLTLHAITVNTSESGSVAMDVSGPSGTGSVSVGYPTSSPGSENVSTVSISGTAAGEIYQVDVTLNAPASGLAANHYRISATGSDLLGTSSPLATQAEHEPSTWVVAAQGESSITLDVSGTTTSPYSSGLVTATDAFGDPIAAFSLGAPPSSHPIPGPLTGAVSLHFDLNGHYVFNHGAQDGGIYVAWNASGQGNLSATLTRDGQPTGDSLEVTIGGQTESFVSGFAFPLPVGAYTVTVFDPVSGTTQVQEATITCDGEVILHFDFPADSSSGDEDNDGIDDGVDLCPATEMPEPNVPTVSLKSNRWMLGPDGDFLTIRKKEFTTTGSGGRSYSLEATRGCNCEQIIEALDKGDGHRKHGCSNSAMDEWVALVSAARVSSPTLQTAEMAALQAETPAEVVLDGSYPNPFNPRTTIRFALPDAQHVVLAVYDMVGRRVSVLADGVLSAGHHEAQFDAASLPSGMYLYKLSTISGTFVGTTILMK